MGNRRNSPLTKAVGNDKLIVLFTGVPAGLRRRENRERKGESGLVFFIAAACRPCVCPPLRGTAAGAARFPAPAFMSGLPEVRLRLSKPVFYFL